MNDRATSTFSPYERHKLFAVPTASQIGDAARWLRLLADCHEPNGEIRGKYREVAELLQFEIERMARQ